MIEAAHTLVAIWKLCFITPSFSVQEILLTSLNRKTGYSTIIFSDWRINLHFSLLRIMLAYVVLLILSNTKNLSLSKITLSPSFLFIRIQKIKVSFLRKIFSNLWKIILLIMFFVTEFILIITSYQFL